MSSICIGISLKYVGTYFPKYVSTYLARGGGAGYAPNICATSKKMQVLHILQFFFIFCIGYANLFNFLHWQCKFFLFFALARQIISVFALAMQTFSIFCIGNASYFYYLHWQGKLFYFLHWQCRFFQFFA